jgi:hypothetical protein
MPFLRARSEKRTRENPCLWEKELNFYICLKISKERPWVSMSLRQDANLHSIKALGSVYKTFRSPSLLLFFTTIFS